MYRSSIAAFVGCTAIVPIMLMMAMMVRLMMMIVQVEMQVRHIVIVVHIRHHLASSDWLAQQLRFIDQMHDVAIVVDAAVVVNNCSSTNISSC